MSLDEKTGKGSQNQGLCGHPVVLVVDDESLVREVTSIMIEDNGGRVLTASGGKEAIKVVSGNPATIDVIIMDFSMPDMNGYEAYSEIRRICHNVPFVFASGLKRTGQVDELLRRGEIQFLSKPYHEAELINAIRTAQLQKV